jgi:lauroyl/myristoyl acyltransferase
MRTTREVMEEAGVRFVTRGGSGDVLLALLERGDVVCLSWDQIGRAEVVAFGRSAPVSAGVDHLAAESGAPVVPALALRRRWRIEVVFGPPVTPGADGRVVPSLVRELEAGLDGRLAQGQDAIALWLTGRAGSL